MLVLHGKAIPYVPQEAWSHSGIQFGLSEMGVAVSLSCALACWQQPAQRPAVTRAWLVPVAVLRTRTWVVSSTRSCSLPMSVITGILADCCSPTSLAPTLFEEPLVQAVWAAEKLGSGNADCPRHL